MQISCAKCEERIAFAQPNAKILCARQKLCRGIALVGQLGFSLITPPVVLLWLAHWLQTKYQLGVWVTIGALILGLLTSASTALQFYRKLSAKKKDNSPKPPRGYGDHI